MNPYENPYFPNKYTLRLTPYFGQLLSWVNSFDHGKHEGAQGKRHPRKFWKKERNRPGKSR